MDTSVQNGASSEPETGFARDRESAGFAADREKPAARLFAPFQWLGRKLRSAVRWAAKLFAPIGRTSVWKLARRGLRLLAGALVRRRPPETKRGFGFWWLVVTVAIAGAVGLIVAALLTPVAGIIALLVVGIWAAIRRARKTDRDEHKDRPARAEEAANEHPSARAQPPVAAASAPVAAATG